MAQRILATVRDPVGKKIRALAEEEDRSISSMAAKLIDEAIEAREAKTPVPQ